MEYQNHVVLPILLVKSDGAGLKLRRQPLEGDQIGVCGLR